MQSVGEMGVMVDELVAEKFSVEMQVYFSGGNGFMAKESLDCAEVGTAL